MKPPNKIGVMPFRQPAAPAAAPNDAAHWRRKGAKLFSAGDRKGAAEAYARYLASPLQDPELRAVAAGLAQGQAKPAEQRLRKFLAANPGDPVGYRMLGQIAMRMEDSGAAEAIFRRTLALAPGFGPLRFELAGALLLQGRVEEAVAELDVALRQAPANPNYLMLRAILLGKLGRFADAAAIYEGLLARLPDQHRLWVGYGQMLRTLRRGPDAIAAFRRAIAIAPHFGEAWWNLANMKTGALTAEDISAIRAAISSSLASAEDRFHLHFALARALEETGDYRESFAEYRKANEQRRAALPATSFTGAAARDRARRTIALFTPEFAADHRDMGDPSEEPIFILGMPRSGSTLLEQILSSHPMIEGTQELADLVVLARELDQSEGRAANGVYPEILGRLSPERLRELGGEYLARARAKRRTDRPFFLDKQPVNWQHIGLIRLILPKARIIDMRRDALGCCLSMFRQHFARGSAFTYSIEGLATEYRAYHDLTAHFDAVMPGAIRQVRLADLIADTEGVVRGVLDYLGLPFAPECLRYFESDRAVFTPSSEQVRRPINRESADLLRNFEPYVDELKTALGDLVD